MRNRNIYHPVDIRADFVRKNAFEIIITDQNPLLLLCKTLTITLPATNAVQVPWISGVMQLAGRSSTAYTFTGTFLAGREKQHDCLENLYAWRNQVFNHDSGRIALAHEYKKETTINIYDVTGDLKDDGTSLQYVISLDGVWPTNIDTINLSVEDDTVLEVSATFAADKIWVKEFKN